ncbi:MAG: hypothetical protein IPJ65_04525 [Archangiaceae bacterium]|nr:hypothetical protein [Archangiaceae bacterium]
MTPPLPPGLDDAFLTAATELGMCSAAWLFTREAEAAGPEHLAALRDALGRAFPVLDAVVAARLAGGHPRAPSEQALDALAEYKRVVVVGLEAQHLDAMVARRRGQKLALLTEAALPTDWARVLSNFAGAVEAVDLASFQGWAGPQSALLTSRTGSTARSPTSAPCG